MPAELYFAVKVFHILAIAVWVGGPPVAGFFFRRSLRAGDGAAHQVVKLLQAATPVFVISALATLLTGSALIGLAGGFSHVRTSLLVGAGISLCTMPIGGGVIRPTLARLEQTLAQPGGLLAAEPLIRRFNWAQAAEGALRFIALVLMVLPL